MSRVSSQLVGHAHRAAHPTPCHGARGFTLVELVIFIVVVSILGVAMLAAFSTSVRYSPAAGQITQATQLAQQRMEFILAQRRAVGFAAFTDPCLSTITCTPPTGYVVSANIAPNWNGDTNYRVITVTVTGTSSAQATALVASY